MSARISSKALAEVVALVAPVVKKSTVPILESLHIVFEENRIAVTGTDMDMRITAFAPAVCVPAPAICVPAARLKAATGHLRGEVSIDVCEAGTATFKSNGMSAQLPTRPPGDFPMPSEDEKRHVVRDAAFAIDMASRFAAKDDGGTMTYLSGVRIDDGKAIATDGARIVIVDIPETKAVATLPGHMCATIVKFLSIEGAYLEVGERSWRVHSSGASATGKLISSPFPDWRRAIRNTLPVASASRHDLISSLDASSLGAAPEVKISTYDGAIWMNCLFEGARGAAECVADVHHDGLKCTLNARNLKSSLAVAPNDVVLIGGAQSATGVGIVSMSADGWLMQFAVIRSEDTTLPSEVVT